MRIRNVFIVVSLTGFLVCGQSPARQPATSPEVREALDGIRAEALRGDLSFIASDLLEGRDSPSRGLDIAAEYIAAQFRIAGLEPGVRGDYFQAAEMVSVEPNFANFEMQLSRGKAQLTVHPNEVALRLNREIDLNNAPLFKLDLADSELLDHLTSEQLDGKVVITEFNPRLIYRLRGARQALSAAKPALTILVDRDAITTRQEPSHRLESPDKTSDRTPDRNPASARITLSGEAAARFYAGLKPGLSDAFITAHVAAPLRKRAILRNVIGILRGSDPALRDTCILLTAHYDHLGMRPGGSGDRIYNGANDNGSGTVSVIAAARALAELKQRPKRSILFIAFFGEEEGLLGSEYYAHHPVWPLDKTDAQLNLEQVGRTDSTEGPQISSATLTGFDYTSLTSYVERAGASTGVRIYKHMTNSDAYFPDSDNLSLAEAGVPAETLAVTFDFPDYHAVGDEWQKIDYNNMAQVDRAITLSVYLMANSGQAVHWNEDNPKTAPYVKAWDRLRGQ
ncbi:MAG TPA: M28 family peptidase [Bryobacteraceae bacterium]|nr:M28 family peptidase [Bryobacteraceae bacterium]